MPATVTLELEGGDPSRVKHEHIRGYLSHMMERAWPKELHDDGVPVPSDAKHRRTTKLYSAYPTYDESRGRVKLQIHLLDAGLLDHVTSTITASRSIRFGSQTFTITGFSWSMTPWADLATGTGRTGDLLFTFRTPVILREGDCPLPFPLPRSLFESLSHRWNTFVPSPLSVPVDFTDAGLVTVDLRIHTEIVRYERKPYVGLLGYARYSAFGADQTLRAVLETLGRFSRFSGIGSFTTAGFGVTEFDLVDRLLPPCRRHRRDADGPRR